MNLQITQTELKEILPLRELYLQEINAQSRYHACHERGWSDSYTLVLEGKKIGYGSVKGLEALSDRDAIFEFYILPFYRKYQSRFFSQLLEVSEAAHIECQTNDPALSALMYEFAESIHSDVVLFEDHISTQMIRKDVVFRRRRKEEDVFGKKEKDIGPYVLEKNGEVVADGGFLTHYNAPFADLFMEVKKEYWGQGLGSYMLQEVKKECYRAGRAPAARCYISNHASRATLLKAGMKVCGFMLTGSVR